MAYWNDTWNLYFLLGVHIPLRCELTPTFILRVPWGQFYTVYCVNFSTTYSTTELYTYPLILYTVYGVDGARAAIYLHLLNIRPVKSLRQLAVPLYRSNGSSVIICILVMFGMKDLKYCIWTCYGRWCCLPGYWFNLMIVNSNDHCLTETALPWIYLVKNRLMVIKLVLLTWIIF